MANVKADRVKKQFEKPPKQKREETVKYPKYAKPETLRGTQIRPQDELQRHGREKAVNPESFRGKKAQRDGAATKEELAAKEHKDRKEETT